MAYVKEYWTQAESLKEKAKRHAEQMEKLYASQIAFSSKNTKVFGTDFRHTPDNRTTTIISVENMGSVEAVFAHQSKKTAVLNFASYKDPGGLFMKGSKAQEECLCHASNLYNVLARQKAFYEWNNGHKNRALYMNRGLYSPDIVFFDEDGNCTRCDVITCACPNKSTAQKYQGVSDFENSQSLSSRVRFVLDIASYNEVDTLILGAYGCGVFGQNPKEVADIFKENLIELSCFQKVVFAIPDGNNGNYMAFVRVFED